MEYNTKKIVHFFPPLCAFSTMTTLQFIANQILSALLITFTYAIPLLSSIRAIHHRDRESYQQWLTYFLLIFLLTPLFDIMRVHDGFRLVVVIWLGQKFQGALFVYNEVFDVAMEKYGVEDKVDQQIQHVKKSIKDAMWRIAKDIGWSALSQIGEVLSFVQDSASNFAETNINLNTNANHKNDAYETNQMEMNKEKIRLKKEQSSESLQTRKPSHSVLDSLSTPFPSVESMDILESEAYIADFISMLKDGLYVFSPPNISHGQVDGSSNAFSLKVFFYECDNDNVDKDEREENDDFDSDENSSDGKYFVLHPVESNSDNYDDIDIILATDVRRIRRSGTNAIEFMTWPEEMQIDMHSSGSENDMVAQWQTQPQPQNQTKNSMVRTSSIASIPEKEEMTNYGQVEKVMAQIVLSNAEDRETLFHGLMICFPEFAQEYKVSREDSQESHEEERQNVPDDVDDAPASDHSSFCDAEVVDWNENFLSNIDRESSCRDMERMDVDVSEAEQKSNDIANTDDSIGSTDGHSIDDGLALNGTSVFSQKAMDLLEDASSLAATMQSVDLLDDKSMRSK